MANQMKSSMVHRISNMGRTLNRWCNARTHNFVSKFWSSSTIRWGRVSLCTMPSIYYRGKLPCLHTFPWLHHILFPYAYLIRQERVILFRLSLVWREEIHFDSQLNLARFPSLVSRCVWLFIPKFCSFISTVVVWCNRLSAELRTWTYILNLFTHSFSSWI